MKAEAQLYYFHDLFRKYRDESVTKKTLLFQDILRYALKTENSFRVYDLTDWLIKNNKELSSSADTKKSKSGNIENRQDRIKEYLETLKDLELITSQNVKATKGDATTKEYTLTDFGKFISFIVEFDQNQEIKKETIDIFYNFLQEHFKKEPISSRDLFAAEYFKRCKEYNLFHEHINGFLKNLKSFPEIQDKNDFLRQIIFIPLNDHAITKRLWFHWVNSLRIFNSDESKLLMFLHSVKLQLQKIIEENIVIVKFNYYETQRYNCKEYPDVVTVQCTCKKCGLFSYVNISLIKYLTGLIIDPEDLPQIECKKCRNFLFFFKPY